MGRSKWFAGVGVLGLLTCGILGGAGGLGAQQATPAEWQPNGRPREYVRSIVGPPALLDVGVGAGIDQWRDQPDAWDDDWNGFGKRLASNAGRNFVEESVRHGLAAAFDRSVTYQRCACEGVGPRAWHAFVETVTDRSLEGERQVGFSRLAGFYVGAYAQTLWTPDEEGADVIRIGTRGIAFGFLGSLWREFVAWP